MTHAGWFSIALIGTMLTATLTGCSQSRADDQTVEVPSNTTAGDPVQLDYYTWADETDYVSDAITAFNALHTDIEVSLHILPNENYNTSIETLLSHENHGVDLCGSKGMADLISLYEDGYIHDITNDVRNAMRDGDLDVTGYGTLFNDILYDNKYLALPTRTTCWALYYNRNLVSLVDDAMPRQLTWSEYRDLTNALTQVDADGNTIYGGCIVDWIPNLSALQHGSYLTDDDITVSRDAIEMVETLYADGSHVPFREIKQNNDSYAYELFLSGSIATLIQGEWFVNILVDSDTDVDWGIAPLPIDTDVPANTSTGQYQFVSITSDCENPEAAFTFLSFLAGEEGASIYAQNAIVPAYNNKEIMRQYTMAAGNDDTRYFLESRKYPEQLPILHYDEVRQAFSTNANLYWSGEYTLDEAMDAFLKERSVIYANELTSQP